MNQYEKYNVDLHEARIRNGSSDGPTSDLGYVCVHCGKHVSGAVVRFYGRDPYRIICYKCQEGGGSMEEIHLSIVQCVVCHEEVSMEETICEQNKEGFLVWKCKDCQLTNKEVLPQVADSQRKEIL